MIPYGKHHIDEEDINAVVRVLQGGSLTQGAVVEEFEAAIADYVGSKFAVAVSSGTAALHLAMMCADVGPGGGVVTSPITFVASANASLYLGGNVAFSDIDAETLNICPLRLADTLSQNSEVRAVVPVHMGGLPCDVEQIKKGIDGSGIVVIEDAAHALGARYPDGLRVGCCANSSMTIFSLHPVKAIAAGEGGVITTNDEMIWRRLMRLRSHGINKNDDALVFPDEGVSGCEENPWYYEMQELGFHYRITDIQCGLALEQLKKLDLFMEQRRRLVRKYDSAFSGMKNCRPAQLGWRAISGNHLYILRIDFSNLKINRAQLMVELRRCGIGTQVHYIPIPRHPFYRQLGFDFADYPASERYYQEALSIPLFYDLSDDQQNFVIENIWRLVG